MEAVGFASTDGGDIVVSNAEAKVIKDGLLAIVVYGELDARPVLLLPKPKSICMAPSVAVGCGRPSSRRLSMEGSKAVSELQSSGFVDFGGDAIDVDAIGERVEPKSVE